MAPPLSITEEEIDTAMEILDESLAAVLAGQAEVATP
jgi:4-aminobutyrate aminotransferase-like enzyme